MNSRPLSIIFLFTWLIFFFNLNDCNAQHKPKKFNNKDAVNGVWVDVKFKDLVEKYDSYAKAANQCYKLNEWFFSSIYINGNEIYAYQLGESDYKMNKLKNNTFNMYLYGIAVVDGEYYDFEIIQNSLDTFQLKENSNIVGTRTYVKLFDSTEKDYPSAGEEYLKTYCLRHKNFILYDWQKNTEKTIGFTEDKIDEIDNYNYRVEYLNCKFDVLVLYDDITMRERTFIMDVVQKYIFLKETYFNPVNTYSYKGVFFTLSKQKPDGSFYNTYSEYSLNKPNMYDYIIFIEQFEPATFPVKEGTCFKEFDFEREKIIKDDYLFTQNDPYYTSQNYTYARYKLPFSNNFESIVITYRNYRDLYNNDINLTTYLTTYTDWTRSIIDKIIVSQDNSKSSYSIVSEIDKDLIRVNYLYLKNSENPIYKTITYTISDKGYFKKQDEITFYEVDEDDY